jgi:hypothetical protein
MNEEEIKERKEIAKDFSKMGYKEGYKQGSKKKTESKINKSFNEKTINRKIIKDQKYTVKIKEAEQINPLHHENIHFKKTYDKEKRNLFLS